MKNTKKSTATTKAEVTTETIAEPTQEVTATETPKVSQQSKKEVKMENKTENKNAFNTLLEAQTKFVDTLVDNTKKFTEVINANEAVEKVRIFVNEWLEKQQTNLENVSETVKKQVSFEKTPTFVQDIVKAQQEFGKEWFTALRATLKAKDLKDLNDILLANVEKLQENVKGIAGYAVENFGKPVKFNEVFTAEYAKDITTKWLDMWKPIVK
jgi:hypothetical protein